MANKGVGAKSKHNKGVAASSDAYAKNHKIAWSKIDHGPPPVKTKPGWVHRILANQQDCKKSSGGEQ